MLYLLSNNVPPRSMWYQISVRTPKGDDHSDILRASRKKSQIQQSLQYTLKHSISSHTQTTLISSVIISPTFNPNDLQLYFTDTEKRRNTEADNLQFFVLSCIENSYSHSPSSKLIHLANKYPMLPGVESTANATREQRQSRLANTPKSTILMTPNNENR